MDNKIITTEISYWEDKYPYCKKAFQHEGIKFLIEALDIISYKIKDQSQIPNFIFGLLLMPLIWKTKDETKLKEYEEKFEELTRPIFDLMTSYFKNDYRHYLIDGQITGESVLKVNGVEEPISHNAIFLHTNRTGKFPMTVKDIEEIEQDFVRYRHNLFGEPPIIKSNMNLDLLDNLFILEMTRGEKPTKLEILKKDLMANICIYTGRQIIALANVIFESGMLHKSVKPDTFSKWVVQFCKIVGVDLPTSKKNAVKREFEMLKKAYYYLIP